MPNSIDFSNPQLYNEHYIPLLSNKKRYNFLMGGGGSWKSVFQSQREIIKSFQSKTRTLCVRKVYGTLKDSCYAELVSRIEEWNLWDYFEVTKSPLYIKNKMTWSDFVFRGMDDPEKIKSIANVKRIWIEEATELHSRDFDQLDLRVRGAGELQITCTLNPVDAENWINERFWKVWQTDDVELLHSTYLNNRFIGDEYRKVMERLSKDNPSYYKIYALWEWWILEGRIFDNWTSIEKIPDEAKLLGYGLDFWFTNDPTSMVALYRYNSGIIVDEMLYSTWLTNQDIASRLKGINKRVPIYADSAEPKSIEELKRAWFYILPAKKGKDSIKHGIDSLLSVPVSYTASSANLHKEHIKYTWKIDKDWRHLNEPVWWFDHAIDALRYVASSTIFYETSSLDSIKNINKLFLK